MIVCLPSCRRARSQARAGTRSQARAHACRTHAHAHARARARTHSGAHARMQHARAVRSKTLPIPTCGDSRSVHVACDCGNVFISVDCSAGKVGKKGGGGAGGKQARWVASRRKADSIDGLVAAVRCGSGTSPRQEEAQSNRKVECTPQRWGRRQHGL